MLNYLMQFAQVVTGHRGIHVVFDMKVHVPVEKLDKGIQDDRARTEPEVGHIVLQPHVLGVITQKEQATTVEGRQGDQNWDQPETKIERDDSEQGMAHQQDTRPIEEPLPFGWL